MKNEQIIIENEERKKAINVKVNQLTGEGCVGDRFALEVPDAPIPYMMLPIEMQELRIVKDLQRTQSLSVLAQSDAAVADELWQMFCETRMKYDFEFFAYTQESITDKETSHIMPFTLRRPQRKVLKVLERMRKNEEPIRIILLKARQWGGSTLVQMYMLWIQICLRDRWNSVVCAHVLDGARTISSMYDTAIKEMPEINSRRYDMKPFGRTNNIRLLTNSESRITVGTAEEPDGVRSQDPKMVHFSEVGLFPNTKQKRTEDLVTSMVAGVPRVPLTCIILESTAKGVGDYFHTQWLKAKKGETAYNPIFVAWFEIEIYTMNFGQIGADGKYKYYSTNGALTRGTLSDFVDSLSDYEKTLFLNNKGCTLENINWYRSKRSEMPTDALMQQEYPSNDMEAFQNSGQPAFRAQDVERLRQTCRLPVEVGELVSDVEPSIGVIDKNARKGILSNIRFIKDEDALSVLQSSDVKLINVKCRNRFFVWKEPAKEKKVTNRYIVTYDPSRGKSEGADFGDITVFDRYWMIEGGKPEVVAELHFREDRDIAIWRAAMIATWYHNALLVIESNTFDTTTGRYEEEGELIFDVIANNYDNLYSRTSSEKIKAGAPIKWGFFTGRSEKPMLVSNHQAILREDGYIERSEDAVNEQRVYERKTNGEYGAVEGQHDDRVMARLIGTYVCYKEPIPTKIVKVVRKKRTAVNESSISF